MPMMGDDTEGLKALLAVQKVFPSALLAGGYLRDCWFGRSPRDIDIFVEYSGSLTSYDLEDKFGRANVSWMAATSYCEMGDVFAVWDIKGYALPVQVVMLAPGLTTKSRIRDHDFDFCQIWHDGWSLGASIAFMQMNAHMVTLVACESQHEFDRSMRRWERLKVKYPDFTLVIPKRFQHFQTNKATHHGKPS